MPEGEARSGVRRGAAEPAKENVPHAEAFATDQFLNHVVYPCRVTAPQEASAARARVKSRAASPLHAR